MAASFALLAMAGSEEPSLERARALLEKQSRTEAVTILKALIQREPENAPAHLLLGVALADLNDREEALSNLKEAVRLEPKWAKAHNALGEALDEFGEVEPAGEEFRRAAELDPKDARAQSNWGTVLLEQNRPEEAAVHLDRALRLYGSKPDASYTYYLRAKIWSRSNDAQHAAAALQKAVALNPDLAEAWSDLGENRKLLGNDEGALEAYKQAVKRNPEDAVAQYRLGSQYLRLSQGAQAVGPLEAAYKLKPDDQSTLNALQTALRQTGKVDEARKLKKQLSDLLRQKDEEHQRALEAVKVNNEGAALEKAGDLRGAAERYRQAVDLDPQHVGMRVNFAVALLRMGQWTDGLNELHRAHEQDPDNQQIKAALDDALAQAPPALVPHWKENR